MLKTNEQFLEMVERFRLYVESGKLDKEELGYKRNLVESLGASLSGSALDTPRFAAEFSETFRRLSAPIINLTFRNDYDDFKKNLDQVAPERLKSLFEELFDERINLATRFNKHPNRNRLDYLLRWVKQK